mmetsp:Transcript_22068/g.48763  ORF Transcript_22068/g.48763 Transcript_22068/m.48763 type:complete len:292 (-) Transcript_22068:31-906(-)
MESTERCRDEKEQRTLAELELLDGTILKIRKERDREIQELTSRYADRRAAILEKRRKILVETPCDTDEAEEGEDGCLATQGLKGFWLEALENLPTTADLIEPWDKDVLMFLENIEQAFLDPGDHHKGFQLTFHFILNPYFTNEVLVKEYHTSEPNCYSGSVKLLRINASPIKWEQGMDVTMGKFKKKGKKARQEPRDSFFRNFFRTLAHDMPLPSDVNVSEAKELIAGGRKNQSNAMMDLLMENDLQIGISIQRQLVPFAVRWYTGEACPAEDESSEGEGDESSESEADNA